MSTKGRWRSLLFLFLLWPLAVIGQTTADEDKTPQAEFVMELHVKIGEAFSVGQTPHGKRVVIPITGGTFQGPRLKGEILEGGADYQLVTADKTELEAIYSIRTHDGVNIHVRNTGLISKTDDGASYFVTSPRFEAPSDSPYAFLNRAIFVCKPGEFADGCISLLVWMVR